MPIRLFNCWLVHGLAFSLIAMPMPVSAAEFSGELVRAIIVGAGDYTGDIPPLPCAGPDAELLAGTLHERGWVPSDNIVLLVDGSDEAKRPQKTNIARSLQAALDSTSEDECVLFYFSGHGLRDEQNGETYLVPVDADLEKLDETAIKVGELLESLASAKAKRKFLILDACHSGNPGAVREGKRLGLTEEDLKQPVTQQGVYTLVSCQVDQESLEGLDMGHGLYTYWLCKGLQGLADDNGDGSISADELNRFTTPIVVASAERVGHQQTPGRIVPPAVIGDPVVLELAPESFTSALDRISELLHEEALSREVTRLGVFPFLDATPNPEAPDEDARIASMSLARSAAERIEQNLANHHKKPYALVEGKTLQRAIRNDDVGLTTDGQRLQNVSQQLGKVSAYVFGSLVYLENQQRMRVSCKLIDANTQELLGLASAVVAVDAALYQQYTGRPLVFPARPKTFVARSLPELHDAIEPPIPAQPASTSPLLDPSFPYRLEVRSKGVAKELHPGREPGEVLVFAKPGEEFELRIANDSGQDAFLRLFIDGRNVLGNKVEDVNKAWAWIAPKGSQKSIAGWYYWQGSDGKDQSFSVKPFVFEDPPRTRSIRRTFAEAPGEITAYWYKARPMAWIGKLGVGEVDAKKFVETYPNTDLGGLCLAEPLAMVTIRYVREND